MKSAIGGATCIIIILCTFLLIGSVTVTSNAKQRAVNTANECAYSAIVSVYDSPDEWNSNDELAEAYIEAAEAYLKSQNQRGAIKIYGIDYEKGLIDAEVVCYYQDLFGEFGVRSGEYREVAERRTVVIDKSKENIVSNEDEKTTP